MQLNIVHADIGSDLCQRCAACCRISFRLVNTDSRYRAFLRTIGYSVIPPAAPGEDDCCGERHDITIDMGLCKHLEVDTDAHGRVYRCRLYGSSEFPELCADFDCVSWAKHSGTYDESNSTLAVAQRALETVRARRCVSSDSVSTVVESGGVSSGSSSSLGGESGEV